MRTKTAVSLLVALLLGAAGFSQQVKILDFSGGLNTLTNPAMIQPNQASRFQNWSFDDQGTLIPRPGYHQVRGSLTGYSACLWMLGVKPNRWQATLVQEYQVSGANDFSKILAWRGRAGALAGDSAVTLISNWYPGQTISTQDDRYLYLTNGHNMPYLVNTNWDTMQARPITPPAPGQLLTAETRIQSSLVGEYRYAVVAQVPCSTVASFVPWSQMHAPLSVPVSTNHHAISVTCFYPYGDPGDGCGGPYPTDLRWYLLVRTKNAKWSVPMVDSLFVIDSFLLRQDTCYRAIYIDSTSDASLTSSRFWMRITDTSRTSPSRRSLYQWEWLPTESLGTIASGFTTRPRTAYVVGTPSYKETYPGGGANVVIGADELCGVDSHLVNFYWMTLADKATGAESDTSAVCYAPNWRYGGYQTSTVYLKMPPVPSAKYERRLYRSFLATCSTNVYAFRDSTVIPHLRTEIIFAVDTFPDSGVPLCGSIDAGQRYLENLGFAKGLLTHEAWEGKIQRERFDGMVFHDGRFYGWVNNRIWVSEPDSPGTFGVANTITLSDEAGDRVIGAASMDEGLAAYKENSMWILYTNSGDLYDRKKVSPGFGLASPFGIAKYNGGNLVIGRRGGFYEIPSDNRSLNPNRHLLTNTVWPLMQRDDSVMARAVSGVYLDNWLVNYPGNDTTFCLDLRRAAWSTWSFDFTASTMFDSTIGSTGAALGKFWFVPQGSTTLYELSTGDTTDAGTAFSCVFQKNYLAYSTDEVSIPLEGRFSVGGTSAADSVTLAIKSPGDTTVVSSKFSTKTRFSIRPLVYSGTSFPNWYNLSLTATPHPDLKIFGVEIQLAPAGKNERR